MKVFYIVNDLGYFRQHRENIAVALAAEGHEVVDGDAPGMPTNSELYFISSPTMPTASITV